MNVKILITGPPKSGKSTLIAKLIDYYRTKNIKIYGFITPDVKKNNQRIGFDIKDIYTGLTKKLARIGTYNSQYKLGKYSIFIEEFDETVSILETIDYQSEDLLIIDEIGKMELFSKKFQNFIMKKFDLDINIIATIGQKIRHPIKDYISRITNVLTYSLNQENAQELFQKIISLLK